MTIPPGEPHVIFFLGAGVSLCAGMPGTQCITDRVLSGEGVIRDSEDRYRIVPQEQIGEVEEISRREYVEPVIAYVNRLNDWAKEMRSGRTPNYEDIYYHAMQVRNVICGVSDDPLLHPVAMQILRDTVDEEKKRRPVSDGEASLSAKVIIGAAQAFISSVVSSLLANPPGQTDHLHLIGEGLWGYSRVSG